MKNILLAVIVTILLTLVGYCQSPQDLIGDVTNLYTDSVKSGNNLILGYSFWGLMGGILFGSIGFIAFMYGKRSSELKPMITGILLMGYPYFIKNSMAIYLVGIALTVALFVWRE